MEKVIFFVDGFNLYHSLNDYVSHHKYKWLDLSKLAKNFVTKKQVIEDLYYFTALPPWSQDKIARHNLIIDTYKDIGIKIVLGEFKKITKRCRATCKQEFKTYEEKRTDVNIAIYLFKLAYKNKYDKAFIISGDTDLIPAIKYAKSTFKDKEIGLIIPFGRKAEDLKSECDFHMKIKEKHLRSSRLDDPITLSSGKVLACPTSWK